MTIYNGAIEMGLQGSECLPMDVVFNVEDTRPGDVMPNYGTKVPSIVSTYFNSTETTSDPIKFEVLFGTEKTQVIFSFDDAETQNWLFFGSQPGFAAFVDKTGSQYRVTIQILVQYAPFFNVIFAEALWTSLGPRGRNNRHTLLISIDGCYHTDGNGPLSLYGFPGFYALDSQTPFLWNGASPLSGRYGSTPFYTIDDCNPWAASNFGPAQEKFVVLLPYKSNLSTVNGFAFRRSPSYMTRAQYDCWHNVYDWTQDPQFR